MLLTIPSQNTAQFQKIPQANLFTDSGKIFGWRPRKDDVFFSSKLDNAELKAAEARSCLLQESGMRRLGVAFSLTLPLILEYKLEAEDAFEDAKRFLQEPDVRYDQWEESYLNLAAPLLAQKLSIPDIKALGAFLDSAEYRDIIRGLKFDFAEFAEAYILPKLAPAILSPDKEKTAKAMREATDKVSIFIAQHQLAVENIAPEIYKQYLQEVVHPLRELLKDPAHQRETQALFDRVFEHIHQEGMGN